jgi:hypothetical protein
MLDASGKPPSNLFAANTNWMGDWNSCHKVKKNHGPLHIRGRYCRAKVRADPSLVNAFSSNLVGLPGDPARLAALDVGLCVPNYCGSEDIAILLRNSLKLMTIHDFTAVNDVDGVVCEGPSKPPGTYYFTIVLITILTIVVVLATLYDCFYRTILNRPFASMSTISIQGADSICNFSSSRPTPDGTFYKHLEATYYAYSNRLKLHGMRYSSEEDHTNVKKMRKNWFNHWIYRAHKITLDLSAYTAILKSMSSTGELCR